VEEGRSLRPGSSPPGERESQPPSPDDPLVQMGRRARPRNADTVVGRITRSRGGYLWCLWLLPLSELLSLAPVLGVTSTAAGSATAAGVTPGGPVLGAPAEGSVATGTEVSGGPVKRCSEAWRFVLFRPCFAAGPVCGFAVKRAGGAGRRNVVAGGTDCGAAWTATGRANAECAGAWTVGAEAGGAGAEGAAGCAVAGRVAATAVVAGRAEARFGAA